MNTPLGFSFPIAYVRTQCLHCHNYRLPVYPMTAWLPVAHAVNGEPCVVPALAHEAHIRIRIQTIWEDDSWWDLGPDSDDKEYVWP